ncbi:unnamed protein product [marine sediment metagenome]|uniref:Uncharacterized protein n=1 Tax=marine sediment metagenome TaxID=412755 RepID=X1JHZ3_9ZZZZ
MHLQSPWVIPLPFVPCPTLDGSAGGVTCLAVRDAVPQWEGYWLMQALVALQTKFTFYTLNFAF